MPPDLGYEGRQIWRFIQEHGDALFTCLGCEDENPRYTRYIQEIHAYRETVEIISEYTFDGSRSQPEHEEDYDIRPWECYHCERAVTNDALSMLLSDLDKEPY